MIAIIGAGISGLSTAYLLEQKGIECTVFESSHRAGGYIKSLQYQYMGKDYLLEEGPNSLLADTKLADFVKGLGLESEIVYANDVSKNRYIYRKGKYQKLPSSPPELLFNSFFSLQTKWAIFRETQQKAKDIPRETLNQFFKRRFSQEVVDYALNPFVSGIYAGNPAELLLEKTFPNLAKYEQDYGSVLKGFIKNKTGTRKQSFSFKAGMQALPLRIAEKLKDIHYKERVLTLQKEKEKVCVKTNKTSYLADKAILTSSSFASADFLEGSYPKLSRTLREVYYPPIIAVHSIYKKEQVQHGLNGFGGLNPKVENRFTAGSIWSSSVFEGRCPEDEVLFTSFVGGSQYLEHTRLLEVEVLERVHTELAKDYYIMGKPLFQNISRWDKSIPQYDQKIIPAHQEAESLERDSIFINANWRGGVSISDCVKKSQALVEAIVSSGNN